MFRPQNLRVNYFNIMEIRFAQGRMVAEQVPGFFLSDDLENALTRGVQRINEEYAGMIGNAEVLVLPKQSKGKVQPE